MDVGEGDPLEVLTLFNVEVDGVEVTVDLAVVLIILPLPAQDARERLGGVEASVAENIGLSSGRHSEIKYDFSVEKCKLILARC